MVLPNFHSEIESVKEYIEEFEPETIDGFVEKDFPFALTTPKPLMKIVY